MTDTPFIAAPLPGSERYRLLSHAGLLLLLLSLAAPWAGLISIPVAFFLKKIGGTAVFWGAVVAQALVFALYATLSISYLWYNLIGCAACVLFSALLQAALGQPKPTTDERS